jgi:polyhydroxyalkanoate synthesis regulator phasin
VIEEPKRRGRKSKQEEVEDYLRSIGKSLDDLQDKVFETPDDPEEMLEEFTSELYRQMKIGELKSTSLVNGLKAIASLAQRYRELNPPEVVVEEQDVDELLKDAGLPRDRRVELGRQEIDRLRARTSALEVVVARIEGEE